MARITVEDCLDHVDQRNRFHLALIASRRARQLRNGARPLVRSEEDDFTVLALREIAGGQVTLDYLDQIDRDLEGIQEPGGGAREPSAESVAEAAEALGAGMAAGVGGGRASATLENEEEGEEGELETAPEEPELQEDAEGEAEEPGEPEDEEPSDEDEE